MNQEAPKFRISSEIAGDVIEEIDPYDPLWTFTQEILTRTRRQQPDLYRYLKETARELDDHDASYAVSASLTYETITRQLKAGNRTVALGSEDMERHKKTAAAVFDDPRLQDEDWVFERITTNDGVNADSGMGMFLNAADFIAPDFTQFMADFALASASHHNRILILRGFYDVFMPYYSKLLRSSEPK